MVINNPFGLVAGTLSAVVTTNGQMSGAAVQVATISSIVTLGPASLPADDILQAYSQTITATGGTGNKNLTVSVTSEVPGLIVPASGVNSITITGSPTATGTETFW